MSYPIKEVWAGTTSNKLPRGNKATTEAGILYQGPVVSNQLNGVLNYDEGAIRDLQTIGGFYDNAQIYNQNNLVFMLVNENGLVKKRTFLCKQNNTTAKPPLSGSNSSNINGVAILTNSTTTINETYWQEVIVQGSTKKVISTPANYYYQLTPSGAQPIGRLKIGVKKSGALKCYFEIVFAGFENEFSIPVCSYAQSVKASGSGASSGLQIVALPGFFLGIINSQLQFCVVNSNFCDSIEVDYTEANWIPPLSGTSQSSWDSPSSYGCTPYAIRSGGGSYICDIGVVFQTIKLRSAGSNSVSYEFWKFENGFIEWNSAISLPTNWFHQYNNNGCASLNIDVSDCVFACTGANNGRSIGVREDGALPNVVGQEGFMAAKSTRDFGGSAFADFSLWDSSPTPPQNAGFTGAFKMSMIRPSSFGYTRAWGSDGRSTTVSWYAPLLSIDASRCSSVYSNTAQNVYPLRLITNNMVRGF